MTEHDKVQNDISGSLKSELKAAELFGEFANLNNIINE